MPASSRRAPRCSACRRSRPTTSARWPSVSRLPFEIVSDEAFELQRALALPTFATGGIHYLKRLTLGIRDGRIERVYYPVDAPAAHAREVCAWLGMIHRSL